MAELKLGMDELQHLLKLAGVQGPEQQDEPCDGCSDEEMPLDAIVVSQPEEEPQGMQFPRTEIDPDAQHDASMTTDKEVLTNIIRDRLKDYLRNSK